ncbi:MAG: FtsQ-type POTRA domain-containing protein [Oscillospiraceae bacterium]|nr:FtsQ-type POTRA domain-containing protein [Oscillospiraceae bacterium]
MPEFSPSRKKKSVKKTSSRVEPQKSRPNSVSKGRPKASSPHRTGVESRRVTAPPGRQYARPSSRNRKGNYIIYYILIIMLAMSVLLMLSVTVLFPIQSVSVMAAEDDVSFTPDDIIAFADIKMGDNLITYDTAEIEQRIFENFAGLDSATVNKQLPGTINIVLVSGVPYAAVGNLSEYLIISENKRIISKQNSSGGLIEILGYGAQEPVEGGFIVSENERKHPLMTELITDIERAGLEGIKSIDISDTADIKLDYFGRVVIILGAGDDLYTKLITAAGLLNSDYIDKNAYGTLRVSNPEKVSFLPESANEFIPGVITAQSDDGEIPDEDEFFVSPEYD